MPTRSQQETFKTPSENSEPSLRMQRSVLPEEFFLVRLAEQLRTLGMSISFWDASGSIMTAPSFQGQYCCEMCGKKGYCLEAMSQLAQKVAGQGHREITTSPSGCCIFAVPLQSRRRLIGAAVAGFPTLRTIESEEFFRACGRAHLDAEAMASLCRTESVFTERQAESMCSILEWIIQDEQAKEVAKEELATLSNNLTNTYEELSLLFSISGSMKVTHGTPEFFRHLCSEILEVMHVQASVVILHQRPSPAGNNVGPEVSVGDDQIVSSGNLPVSVEQLIEISRRYIAPRTVNQTQRDSTGRSDSENASSAIVDNRFGEHAGGFGGGSERIRSLVASPLITSGQYQGVVIAFNKIDGEFDSADLKLISSISGQAAVFLENRYLYEDVQDLLMGSLHALTSSIDAKDPYTCGHSRRVAIVSRKLAQLYGFDDDRAERIYLAGLMHDVGKIGIPEGVLCKPGKLTSEEYKFIQRHPGIGATILGGIRQMEDLIPVILHHHERLDGGGYPEGLSGGEIPIEALIVGLADSFDAMTSSRTYRDTMPLDAVIAEIRRCSGTQFDPRLAELLLSLDLEEFLSQIRATGTDISNALGEPQDTETIT